MGAELEAERAAALGEETDERELERFEKQAERRYQRTRLRASLIVLGAILALVASIRVCSGRRKRTVDVAASQRHARECGGTHHDRSDGQA